VTDILAGATRARCCRKRTLGMATPTRQTPHMPHAAAMMPHDDARAPTSSAYRPTEMLND